MSRNDKKNMKTEPASDARIKPEARTGPRRGTDFPKKTSPQAVLVSARDEPGITRVETWKLDRLRQHPRQDENFHPLSNDDLARLADDMRRNGQRTPVEVTADGRIVDGHQRTRAAEKLGWATVLVIVRFDLDGDEAAIERRMIEANLHRRQLDTLDRVRLARRMIEIDAKKKPGRLSQLDEQDLRDRLGERLGMSGRNVQRYLNILNTPMEVQRAFSEGKLSMKLAEKVARLDDSARAQIAAAIRTGGDPTAIVVEHVPKATPATVDPDHEYEVFKTAATRAVETLDGHEDKVRGGMDLDQEIETLKQASSLISRLIARHKALKKLRAETLRTFRKLGDGHP